MHKFGLLIILLFWLFSGGRAQTVYIPAGHQVYGFLERMETRGLLTHVLNGTRPMTRLDIAGYLKILDGKRKELSRLETRQLDDFISKFREELPGLYKDRYERIRTLTGHKWIDPWLPDVIYQNGRDTYAFDRPEISVRFNPVVRRSALFADADTLDSREKVYENGNGVMMWGTLGDHLGFYTHVQDTKEWGTRDYPGEISVTRPGLGFVLGGGDHLYHDETRAYLVYNHAFLTLQYGKDKNQWGPGYRGQLMLSDAATSYDQFKLQVALYNFKYTGLVAVLKHYDVDYFYGNHQQKYMAAHRFEFAPLRWINLGMQESVIYAGRGFEPDYFNPVMFFRSAEHYLGDRDNAAMGVDMELYPVNRVKIYGELFVDDISTGKIGSSFYGNKYAWLAGLYHTNPLGLRDSEFRLEYTFIRPFTYTHKYDITAYRHFITGMGHPLGPNADEWFAELTWRPVYRGELALFVLQQRHGANSDSLNAGGSIFTPHDPGSSETALFLGGVREKTRQVGLRFRYELLHELYLSFQYTYGHSTFDRVTGGDWPGDRSEFRFALDLY